jgi:hypothetical protein
MLRKQLKQALTILGLGTILVIGTGAWGMTAAKPEPSQTYAGQVREINIDQCGLEPGSCEGTLVLAQARGQEVTLAIPAGATIQRGGEGVHLEHLGIGNYVMVQAAPQSSDLQGHSLD